MIFYNIKINKNNIYQRVDNFILKFTKNNSLKQLYKNIRKKKILINKKKTFHKYKLKKNDIININKQIKIKNKKKTKTILTYIVKNIITENKNFLAIDKPPNLPTHGGSNIKEDLITTLRNINRYKNKYIELCHRLDKETSGCIIIAKNKKFLKKFQELLLKKKIKKEYHTLVEGNTKAAFKIKITQKILNFYNRKIKKKNKQTETYCKIIKFKKKQSLIKVFPKTGKTHQIRIHLAHIGYPIVFDKKYGKKLSNKINNKKKMFLHSKSIKFKCPISKIKFYIKTHYNNKFKNN